MDVPYSCNIDVVTWVLVPGPGLVLGWARRPCGRQMKRGKDAMIIEVSKTIRDTFTYYFTEAFASSLAARRKRRQRMGRRRERGKKGKEKRGKKRRRMKRKRRKRATTTKVTRQKPRPVEQVVACSEHHRRPTQRPPFWGESAKCRRAGCPEQAPWARTSPNRGLAEGVSSAAQKASRDWEVWRAS